MGISTNPNLKQAFLTPKAITANKVLTGTDSETAWTNTNATGSITITLPLAAPGLRYTFLVSSANNIVLTPKTPDTIRGQAMGASLTLTGVGTFVLLDCITPVFWEVITGNSSGGGGGSGTVTSVGLSNSDGNLVITGTNPVTTSGTIAVNLSTTAAADLALAATALQVVVTADSVQGAGTVASPIELVGDVLTPGATQLYGTNGAGTRGWYAQPAAGGSAVTTITQLGGASQVYTIPAGIQTLEVYCIGGGGGGGGGAKNTVSSVGGGGGGGGGGISRAVFRAADLGATVTVTFTNAATGGAGGVGSLSGAIAATSGTAGSNVSFGGMLIAYGANPGTLGLSGGGGNGGAGMGGNIQIGNNGGAGSAGGTATSGAANSSGSLNSSNYANTGGGGGAGLAAAPVASTGGVGGGSPASPFINLIPGTAGTAGGPGGTGTGGSAFKPSTGGGGGASALAVTGGLGGNGGDFGGGGGGGGATNTGTAGGAGGRGGYAACIIIAW